MRGYWDSIGTPSVVDWCEANYAVSPWIAEFWNTLSSLPILVIGAYGVLRWWQHRDRLELRFGLSFAALAVIGLGSTLFHATLLRLPQASDELPMVWLSLLCFYCLIVRDPETAPAARRRWASALSVYTVVFTAAYFAIEEYFALFLASYAAAVAYVCIVTWRLAFREASDPRIRTLFYGSVVAYIGGFAIFWVPERLLGCEHPFQSIHPHAFFHLSGAVGPYVWILLAALDRLLRRGVAAEVATRPIPFIRPSAG